MFIATVAFISGLYIKAIIIILNKFKGSDAIKLACAIGFHMYISLNFIARDVSINAGLLTGSFFFVGIVAILFMKKILPKITEGTLLLYGLVGLWFCIDNFVDNSWFSLFLITITILYCCAMLVLCVSKIRIRAGIQAALVVIFLFLNIATAFLFFDIKNAISYFEINAHLNQLTVFSVMMLGFVTFQIFSNILYVLYLVPFTNKNQSLKDRMREIREHIETLRSSYIDTDLSIIKTIGVCILFLLLFLNSSLFFFMDETVFLSIVLFVGTFITAEYSYTDKEQDSSPEFDPHSLNSHWYQYFLTGFVLILIATPFVLQKITANVDLSILDQSSDDMKQVSTYVPEQPSETSRLIDLGLSLYSLQEYSKAEKYFREALVLEPDNKYAHNNLGIVLSSQEKYEEAEVEYLKAISLDNTYANPYNNVGKLYQEISKNEKALFYLKEAIRLKPRDQTFVTLGDVYAQMGNDRLALVQYRTAKELGLTDVLLDDKIRLAEYRMEH